MPNIDDNSGRPPRSRFNFRYTPPPSQPEPRPFHNTEREERKAARHLHRATHKVLDKNGPLVFNVAQLMRSLEGATREYETSTDKLLLDELENTTATAIKGRVKFTHVRNDILAQGAFEADSVVTCVRCLKEFSIHVNFELEDIYRPSIDILTGLPIEPEDGMEDDKLVIDENHLLDLGEAIRQQILVSLPMYPICGDDCPGLYQELERINSDVVDEVAEEEALPEVIDKRWAALKSLHFDDKE